jgi:heptosyltransferase III
MRCLAHVRYANTAPHETNFRAARRILVSSYAMTSPLPDAVPLNEVRRALVTKLRHYGDVLLASPVFSTLKRAAPHIEVDALVYSDTAPMLANHPAIARLYTIDREWKRQDTLRHVASEWALFRALRARDYELLIHLTEHPRGLTFARLLRPRYAVTRERDGRAPLWRRRFTHFYKTPARTPRHTVETHLDALRRIGVYPGPGDKRLVLVPGADAEAKVDALLARHRLVPGTFVQAHPGSRWLFKCAPVDRMAALLDRIVASGMRVAITGAPDPRERAIVAQIPAACAPQTRSGLVDLTGMLTMPELAALTARARIFIGVDSAPMHIAAAMQTPTLAFFGPSSEHIWGPWHVARRIIVSDAHPCRPCDLDGCGGGKVSECLTTLAVDHVHTMFVSLLNETAAGKS